MRLLLTSALISAAGLAWTGSATAQGADEGDLHIFTDKKGQTISATLLGISDDRLHMQIRRQDGQEFETPVNLLSLDDQQFVKDWLQSRSSGNPGDVGAIAFPGESAPAPAAGPAPQFRLSVSVSRIPGPDDEKKNGSYTLESSEDRFRIVVRNLSREVLEGAKIEYALVWRDGVAIYLNENSGSWTYTTRSTSAGPEMAKRLGSVDLSPVRFNGEVFVETDPVRIERVLFSGNQLYREDELVGVKLRIRDAEGRILHEGHSGGAEIADLAWEAIEGLADPEATLAARRALR